MNRTAFSTDCTAPLSPAPQFDNLDLGQRSQILPSDSNHVSPAHCLFAPMNYESGYAYPLIVWLHGAESNEEELWQVMPLVSTRNFVAIAPRGTQMGQFASTVYRWGQSVDDFSEATDRVQHCIELACEKFHVHPERIFLAGRADGGTLAQRIAMENPGMVAGAISLGGPTPRGSRPWRSLNEARKLPLLLSVSPEEEGYAINDVMSDLRLLHCAGFQVSLRLYPEGDGLTTTMLSDVNEWIMESFCPTAVASSS